MGPQKRTEPGQPKPCFFCFVLFLVKLLGGSILEAGFVIGTSIGKQPRGSGQKGTCVQHSLSWLRLKPIPRVLSDRRIHLPQQICQGIANNNWNM